MTKCFLPLATSKGWIFFIEDIPFDLKTTYLPENFVKQKRKEAGLPDELTELKLAAKHHNLYFDKTSKPKEMMYEISERMAVEGGNECRKILDDIYNFRKVLIQKCTENPTLLIQNLYEQQGEMRFDASNRLFVVLADTNDFNNSWKLKRVPSILRNKIHAYLDEFSKEHIDHMRIKFTHKAKSGTFSALSDAIFIVS